MLDWLPQSTDLLNQSQIKNKVTTFMQLNTFNNLPSPISLADLESHLWGAATLLRGLIDAGDYKQYIFPLLFYKRLCDVFDEEYQQALVE